MKDFFISYNKADTDKAEWIAWQLEEAGYTTIIQAWDFGPGENFVLAMQKAATEAKRTIAVLSPDYLQAQFTAPEWAAAFAQDPAGEKRLLIPVRAREVELTGLLRTIVYIDLVGIADKNEARKRLLESIGNNRKKPKAEPDFDNLF
ncbi:toll/interleukin-1 receptor domain-containing protein [Nitrosomonas sp.]|uniref:toll/interleukin-1 receptor domain-containing protein n=1 Tax=Nitrosomonas sp. TaxID=42353 RepID=UPI002632880A|nr:toll/interleukin-1 receptor domain-containing protein [Nitrosomonas sp.]